MTSARTTSPILRVATLFTLLAVVAGSIVCATESGMACPTWPGCYPGQLVPGFHLPPWIEFGHRLISGACLVLLIMAATSTWKSRDPWVRWLPWVAVVGAIAAAVFGMSIIFWGIGPWLGALDLICSLIALVAITLATMAHERGGWSWQWTTSSRLGAGVGVGLMAMHALGILVAGPESYTRCMGWPLMALLGYDGHAALQVTRLALAGAMVLALVWLAVTRRGMWLVALLAVVVEFALGGVLLISGISYGLAALYSVVAALVLWFVTLAAGREALQPADVRASQLAA